MADDLLNFAKFVKDDVLFDAIPWKPQDTTMEEYVYKCTEEYEEYNDDATESALFIY